jgi:Na+-transporting methylmalonyl-CoA/oxaloacetate decarboxylase beta subunit
MTITSAASVGIIGGSDGPTSIFVTGYADLWLAAAVLLLIAGAVGAAIHIAKSRKK